MRSRALLKSVVVVGASLTAGCGGRVSDSSGTIDVDNGKDGKGGSSSIDHGASGGSSFGRPGGLASGGASSSFGGALVVGSGGHAPSSGGAVPTEGGTVPSSGGAVPSSGGAGAVDPGPQLNPADCPMPQRFACVCRDPSTLKDEPCLPASRNGRQIRCFCDEHAPLTAGDCASPAEFTCLDWAGSGMGCTCNADAPKVASDCTSPEFYSCHSIEPPVGCACMCCVIR